MAIALPPAARSSGIAAPHASLRAVDPEVEELAAACALHSHAGSHERVLAGFERSTRSSLVDPGCNLLAFHSDCVLRTHSRFNAGHAPLANSKLPLLTLLFQSRKNKIIRTRRPRRRECLLSRPEVKPELRRSFSDAESRAFAVDDNFACHFEKAGSTSALRVGGRFKSHQAFVRALVRFPV